MLLFFTRMRARVFIPAIMSELCLEEGALTNVYHLKCHYIIYLFCQMRTKKTII